MKAREDAVAYIRRDLLEGFHTKTLTDVPISTTTLAYARIDGKFKKLTEFTGLKILWLASLNQPMMEVIGCLKSLETIEVKSLTAHNVESFSELPNLRHLILRGGTKISDLNWVGQLKNLRTLILEGFKRIGRLDALADVTWLEALGFEGSMWTTSRVESLNPLSKLTDLRYLFLTNTRAADRSLRPLHNLKKLKEIELPYFYPELEFIELRKALPELRCSWFETIDRFGSIKAGLRATFDQL